MRSEALVKEVWRSFNEDQERIAAEYKARGEHYEKLRVTQPVVRLIIRALFKVIVREMLAQREVHVRGFGIFRGLVSKARPYFSPAKGKLIMKPERLRPNLIFSHKLRVTFEKKEINRA